MGNQGVLEQAGASHRGRGPEPASTHPRGSSRRYGWLRRCGRTTPREAGYLARNEVAMVLRHAKRSHRSQNRRVEVLTRFVRHRRRGLRVRAASGMPCTVVDPPRSRTGRRTAQASEQGEEILLLPMRVGVSAGAKLFTWFLTARSSSRNPWRVSSRAMVGTPVCPSPRGELARIHYNAADTAGPNAMLLPSECEDQCLGPLPRDHRKQGWIMRPVKLPMGS